MATSAPIKNYGISDLKSLLQPVLTTHYEVNIPEFGRNTEIAKYINIFGISDLLTISCSDASLPGSSLATHELNNDVTGITQRHAYRRLYDDRVDFTFYVTTKYQQILFFEKWIQFISGENPDNAEVLENPYRVKWPEDYKTTIYITKFERDAAPKSGFGKDNSENGDLTTPSPLTYSFFNAYPISISSMQVSYDSSSLLKCTVSFTYERYFSKRVAGKSISPSTQPTQPSQTPATGVPDVSQGSNYFSTNQRTDFNTARNTDLSGISIPTVNTSENQFNREFTTNTTTTFRQEPLF